MHIDNNNFTPSYLEETRLDKVFIEAINKEHRTQLASPDKDSINYTKIRRSEVNSSVHELLGDDGYGDGHDFLLKNEPYHNMRGPIGTVLPPPDFFRRKDLFPDGKPPFLS